MDDANVAHFTGRISALAHDPSRADEPFTFPVAQRRWPKSKRTSEFGDVHRVGRARIVHGFLRDRGCRLPCQPQLLTFRMQPGMRFVDQFRPRGVGGPHDCLGLHGTYGRGKRTVGQSGLDMLACIRPVACRRADRGRQHAVVLQIADLLHRVASLPRHIDGPQARLSTFHADPRCTSSKSLY